jgi:hypothetical protein
VVACLHDVVDDHDLDRLGHYHARPPRPFAFPAEIRG